MSLFDDDKISPAMDRAAQAIDSGASALVRGLQAAASGAAAVAFTPLALGVGTLTLGIVGLTGAIKSATNEASAMARSLSSLRAQTGLSFSQGYGLASRNQLFGISPQETATIYGGPGMNPMMAAMRGAASLGNPYATNFLPQAAERYQAMAASGPFGRQFANSQLNATFGGQAPESIRQAVNLRPDQIRSQLAYGAGVQAQMGITPETLRRYAEEIPLASQRLGFAVSQAKTKLAVELAPAIERSVGAVATSIGANAEKIADGIKAGVRFLVADLPPLLLRGSAGILRGGAALLQGLGVFAQGISGNVRPILTVFDSILKGVGVFAETLSRLGSLAIRVVQNIANFARNLGVPNVAGAIGAVASGQPSENDPAAAVSNTIIGGAAAYVGAPIVAGAVGMAARRTAANKAAAAAAARAVAPPVGANPYASALPSGRAVPRGVLPNAARSGAARIATNFSLRGILRALSAPIVAVGTALGVGGYEAMRRFNVFGYGSMPSTAQIFGTYSGFTLSPTEQARMSFQTSQAARRNGSSVAGSSMNPIINGLLQSNLAGNPAINSTLSNLFSGIGTAANGGASSLLGLADKAEASANGWSAMIERLDKIAQSNDKIAANSDKKERMDDLKQLAAIIDRFGARVAAYIAEDAALNQLRI